MYEAKEAERKKLSLLLLFTKARPAKALLCWELLCTVEQGCYSAYVQIGQIKVILIMTFYRFATLVFF